MFHIHSHDDLIKFYANLNGEFITSTMLIGECGELITAITDSFRNNSNSDNRKIRNREDIISEIVDVFITLNTYCTAHNITEDELNANFRERIVPRYENARI